MKEQNMIEIDTIRFKDLDSGDDALAIVRCDNQAVWLCLASEANGDIELALDRRTAEALMDALRRAIELR
jgi:hypothetical protein